MNNIIKGALLAAAGLAVTATAQAQYTYNSDHLLLGFTKPGSTGDLVIDLGSASSINAGVWGAAATDLNLNGNTGYGSASAFQSQLNSLYGTMNTLNWGVVGGHYNNAANTAIFSTVPTGAAAPPKGAAWGPATSAIDTAGGAITAGNQVVVDHTQGYGNSWSEMVSPGTLTANFASEYNDPSSSTPSTFATGVNYQSEDLYKVVPNSTPQYEGTFTLGSDGSLSFTPVPEPSTCSLLAGFGVLAMIMRNRLARK
jgi:hypothetical protein